MTENKLEPELLLAHPELAVRFAVGSMRSFKEFFWQGDTLVEIYEAPEAVVHLAQRDGIRLICLQRIRDEIRYWLCTDKSRMMPGPRKGETELGVVSSVEAACALCEEFLGTDRQIADLETPRLTRRRQP
jgi:hypothetical protein